VINCPLIININRLIVIDCHRLPSIIDCIDFSGRVDWIRLLPKDLFILPNNKTLNFGDTPSLKNMIVLLTREVCQGNNSSVDDARAKYLLLVLKGIFLLHEEPFRDHQDQWYAVLESQKSCSP